MKKLLLILLLLSVSDLFSQEATKVETIDWLKGHMKYESDPGPYYNQTLKRQTIRFDVNFDVIKNCDCTIFHESWNGFQKATSSTYSFDLNSFSTNYSNFEIEYNSTGSNFLLVAYTYNRAKKIRVIKSGSQAQYLSRVVLSKSSEEKYLYRIRRAFVHLVELCGGKNEKF